MLPTSDHDDDGPEALGSAASAGHSDHKHDDRGLGPLVRDVPPSRHMVIGQSPPAQQRRSSTSMMNPDVSAAASFQSDFQAAASLPRPVLMQGHQRLSLDALNRRSPTGTPSFYASSPPKSRPLHKPADIESTPPSSSPSQSQPWLHRRSVGRTTKRPLSGSTTGSSEALPLVDDFASPRASAPVVSGSRELVDQGVPSVASMADDTSSDNEDESDSESDSEDENGDGRATKIGVYDDEVEVISYRPTFDYKIVSDYLMEAALKTAQSANVKPKRLKPIGFGYRSKPMREGYHDEPRFTFHSETTGTLKADSFETLDFSGLGKPIEELLKSGTFWLDVCGPTAADMQTLSAVFGIHALTAEDITTEDGREKCEVFRNYYFITIRSFDSDQYSLTFLQPINTYILVFRECVLSPTPHAFNVLRRIDQLRAYGLAISPDWLNYALIDDICDCFMPVMRFIELEVDSIDDLVLVLKESEQADMLRRIGHARKQVMILLRLLISKADVIKAVIKRCGERLAPGSETTLYLGDIQDHVITMVQNLHHFENTLARAHSNYLAQISIEITQTSNRTSIIVMRMTAMASILVPLNIITGLWGMNVRVPGEESDSLIWFAVIVFSMFLIAATSYTVVRRMKLV